MPASFAELLGSLLADKVLEVRTSALHALKTLAKLRPALLRSSAAKLTAALLPAVVAACHDSRHMTVQGAAKRTMMHLVGVCGWEDAELASSQLRADPQSAQYCAEFVKRSYRRLAGLESEVELSDVEV